MNYKINILEKKNINIANVILFMKWLLLKRNFQKKKLLKKLKGHTRFVSKNFEMIRYFREHQKFPDDFKINRINEKLESNLCFTNKKREEI